MRLLLFLIFILLYSPCFSGAQDTLIQSNNSLLYDSETSIERVQFDREQISEFKNDKAFDYLAEIENDSWWTRFKRWLSMKYNQLLQWLFGDYTANGVVAFLLLILPYILIAAIMAFVVWLFIRLNPGPSLIGDPETGTVTFNEEEEIVRSQDIPTLIDSAIQAGDYRLAVRYYYLQLLKHLNSKGLINYEFQKTNAEYLAEIRDDSYKSKLKRLMRLYDFIWYGSFNVTEKDFSVAQNSFREVESSISKLPDEK